MQTLAECLAFARMNGRTISSRFYDPPIGDAEAYSLQTKVLNRLGSVSNAWKVGSTSPEAQSKLGTSQPGAARVPDRYRFQSGDDVSVFEAHDLWIESEFALRLGVGLPPRNKEYDRSEIMKAIDGVAPSLEVVGSRLMEGITHGGRYWVTADGGANVALITGAIVEEWQKFDLPNQNIRLYKNCIEVASGLGRKALGDPINVIVWLANHQRFRDGLKRGEIISTGTCTGLVRIAPGDYLFGDFGAIGSVEINLVKAVT